MPLVLYVNNRDIFQEIVLKMKKEFILKEDRAIIGTNFFLSKILSKYF